MLQIKVLVEIKIKKIYLPLSEKWVFLLRNVCNVCSVPSYWCHACSLNTGQMEPYEIGTKKLKAEKNSKIKTMHAPLGNYFAVALFARDIKRLRTVRWNIKRKFLKSVHWPDKWKIYLHNLYTFTVIEPLTHLSQVIFS